MMPHLEYYMQFCEGTVSPRTCLNRKQYLEHFWRMHGEEKITAQSITKVYQAMADAGKRSKYIFEHQAEVKRFLAWCVECELMTSNPFPQRFVRSTVPPKPKPIFTRDEMDRLVKVARETRPDWVVPLFLCWHTGMRLGDCVTLEWNNVDLKERIIRLVPHKTLQHDKSIVIPMSEELFRRLRGLIGRNGRYLFPRLAALYNEAQNACRAVTQEFRVIALKAGVRFTSIHGMRRSFVSRLVNSNIQIETICSLTGHSRKQVETYVSVEMKTKRAAMTAIQEGVPA